MAQIRLQKYLSQCGIASRRNAEKLMLEGEVRVNGHVITELGSKVDPAKDVVKVGNKVVHPAQRGIILLHKPRGVVSTLSDPEGRETVADFLTTHYRSYYPVGRLDYDSSGLVIMTNDGEMAERLLHPRYGFIRVYEVKVRGWVNDETLQKIEEGVRLDDGLAKAQVFLIDRDSEASALRLVVTEGRNHLVRRMMEELGHQVKKLKRTQHGPFKLKTLKPGEIRKLTEREYGKMREAVMEWEPRKPDEKPRRRTEEAPAQYRYDKRAGGRGSGRRPRPGRNRTQARGRDRSGRGGQRGRRKTFRAD